jgi:hypothetical protein
MEILLDGLPLAEVSTSMTINAPASLLLLLYELVAEKQGVAPAALHGTVQNDILKEYVARGNYIFPPKPSMRLTTDLFAYCAERIPKWNTISISGYHIREAGSTAVQELAFTLSNGIAYCRAAVEAGLSPDEFGERLSFFFNAHNDFFQEVAKFRAARRIWARIMKERFGATNPKAMALRFHAQTGGSTLTAQQPARSASSSRAPTRRSSSTCRSSRAASGSVRTRSRRPAPAPTRRRRARRRAATATSTCSTARSASSRTRASLTSARCSRRPTPTGELAFDDCRVPAANPLGAEREGFKIAMCNLERSRLVIAAQEFDIVQGATNYASSTGRRAR